MIRVQFIPFFLFGGGKLPPGLRTYDTTLHVCGTKKHFRRDRKTLCARMDVTRWLPFTRQTNQHPSLFVLALRFEDTSDLTIKRLKWLSRTKNMCHDTSCPPPPLRKKRGSFEDNSLRVLGVSPPCCMIRVCDAKAARGHHPPPPPTRHGSIRKRGASLSCTFERTTTTSLLPLPVDQPCFGEPSGQGRACLHGIETCALPANYLPPPPAPRRGISIKRPSASTYVPACSMQ